MAEIMVARVKSPLLPFFLPFPLLGAPWRLLFRPHPAHAGIFEREASHARSSLMSTADGDYGRGRCARCEKAASPITISCSQAANGGNGRKRTLRVNAPDIRIRLLAFSSQRGAFIALMSFASAKVISWRRIRRRVKRLIALAGYAERKILAKNTPARQIQCVTPECRSRFQSRLPTVPQRVRDPLDSITRIPQSRYTDYTPALEAAYRAITCLLSGKQRLR